MKNLVLKKKYFLLTIKLLFIGCLFLSATTSHAQYYWIGGTGDWADLNHWATTSGGSEVHTVLPGASDDVYIDENSFSSQGTISIDSTRAIHDLICSNDDENVKIKSGFLIVLEVNGNIDLTGVRSDVYRIDVYCDDVCQITVGPEYLKFLGLHGGGVYNMNSGGHIRHFRIYDGILNTNDYDFEIDFDMSLHGSCLANLGSSTIYTQDFEVNFASVNSGTSTIIVHRVFEGNDMDFNQVIIQGKSRLRGSNSYNILEFEPGANVILEAESTQTINNELLLNGTSNNLISISTTIEGTTAALYKTTGTIDGQYLILRDNEAIGGATFNADESIDLGNNSGWNITESMARHFYWIGGSGDWNDVNHWAKISGSSVIHNDLPGLLDAVFFDENSFTEDDQVVHIEDSAEITVGLLDFTGNTYEIEVSGFDNNLNVYGSLLLGDKVEMEIKQIKLLGKGEFNLLPGKDGKFGNQNWLRFEGDAIWHIGSDIDVERIIYAFGTIFTDGHLINTAETMFTGQRKTSLNMESSTYYAKNFFASANTDSLYIEGANSELICEQKFEMYFGDINVIDVNINHLKLVNPAVLANIATDVNFEKLTIIPGKEVSLREDMEFTVNEFIVKGTEQAPIKIYSRVEGMQASIKKVSGDVLGEYLELKDVQATGGATFWASKSKDLGNVDGWIFEEVATKSLKNTLSINTFPNPTSSHIFVELEAASSGRCMIFDILGKQVYQQVFSAKGKRLMIDIAHLTEGTYYIRLETELDSYKGKFVKH